MIVHTLVDIYFKLLFNFAILLLYMDATNIHFQKRNKILKRTQTGPFSDMNT